MEIRRLTLIYISFQTDPTGSLFISQRPKSLTGCMTRNLKFRNQCEYLKFYDFSIEYQVNYLRICYEQGRKVAFWAQCQTNLAVEWRLITIWIKTQAIFYSEKIYGSYGNCEKTRAASPAVIQQIYEKYKINLQLISRYFKNNRKI